MRVSNLDGLKLYMKDGWLYNKHSGIPWLMVLDSLPSGYLCSRYDYSDGVSHELTYVPKTIVSTNAKQM